MIRLMMSLADAGGRIMYSYKELNELAGYTHRVYHMLRIFEDLRNDKYDRNFSKSTEYSLMNMQGKVDQGFMGIHFDHAPIITPAGDSVLVKDLSFEITPGEHLMITGPNGSGKTSIMRVLAGLWPLFKGHLRKPEERLDAIMYIPQRPYLFAGSLRDQIIYPHSEQQMHDTGYTDNDLHDLLQLVYLDYIPAREGGFDAVKEWKDVFSGGEKQRIQVIIVSIFMIRWLESFITPLNLQSWMKPHPLSLLMLNPSCMGHARKKA
jgi:ATP-binding cassette subfamily D (ALD) long-chain fatty acid import protein